MAESKKSIAAPQGSSQIDATIEEFNLRARNQPDANSVLDATVDPEVQYSNVYRDYVSKQMVKSYLRPQSSDVMLDFGCGMGRLSKYFSPSVKHIEGTDRAEEMIKVAQKGAPSNVNYLYTPSHELPYADNHFDKVFTYGVLQHINDEELQKVLGEIYRVMKPGGKFVCLEQTRLKSQWFGQVQLHRKVEDYNQLFGAANLQMLKAEPALRYPSYSLSLWTRFRFLPASLFLPVLAAIEKNTVNRKPEFVEYHTTAFVAEKQ